MQGTWLQQITRRIERYIAKSKTMACVFLLTAISIKSVGQVANKMQITGTAIDTVTNKGLDFAVIGLYKEGATKPFIMMEANGSGAFKLEGIPAGQYRLIINSIGYRTKTIDSISVTSGTAVLSLGNIMLVPVGKVLEEVVVVAKPQNWKNTIDHVVYNAAADVTSQGGIASDMLKKVPMVSVDADGKVELQGNANVCFLINGKPASMFGTGISEVLQSIPASQVKNIEVITNPGAKYDASGAAGIINIVLKEDKTFGVKGSFNLSAGSRLENGSFNLAVRKNNFGMSAFFSGNAQLNSQIINTADRLSFNAARDTLTQFSLHRVSPFSKNGYQSGISFDWNVTPKDALTISAGFNHIITHATGRIAQDQQTYLSSGSVLSDIVSERNAVTDFGEDTRNWSLSYLKTFIKKGRTLNISYVSSASENKDYDSQVTAYKDAAFTTSGIRSNNPGNDRETTAGIDYVEPLAKGFKIETGIKGTFENISGSVVTDTLLNSGEFANNPGQTYSFNFRRNIYAGYISASFSLFNNFLEGKTGLRYERTDTRSDLANTSVPADNTWAPGFSVQHKLNDFQSLRFAYTYRIQRPTYEDLNPFLDVIDPHNLTTGNAQLKNETNQKIEIGYDRTFNNIGHLYIGALYNVSHNNIQNFTTYLPVYAVNGTIYTDVSLSKTMNIGMQNTYGINISGSAVINKKLSLSSDILLLDKNNLVPGLPSVGGISYKANLNITYQLSKSLVAEVFGMYNSKRTDFQSVRPCYYNYTMAVKKQVFDKKGSIGLTFINPFSRYINQYSSSYGEGFTQNGLRQTTMSSFGLTFSYKFGRLKNDMEKNK